MGDLLVVLLFGLLALSVVVFEELFYIRLGGGRPRLAIVIMSLTATSTGLAVGWVLGNLNLGVAIAIIGNVGVAIVYRRRAHEAGDSTTEANPSTPSE